ncbi:MAG: hypothetical protein HY960_00920 [Ignavibacteriae bacterium]|nr:hypothetical protein [Ignavibacteriota bacterium]
MSTLRILLQIVISNFYDEIRRDKFFLTSLAILAIIVAAVPPPDASHTIINLGNYRPLYNSAWIGTVVAVLTSMIIALTGFYLLRGRIEKDKYLGISELYATTKLGKATYIFGKFLSNVAVLSLIVLLTALASIILQLNFGEEPYIHLWSILSPFLMITLPVVLIVSSLSIFFEISRGLNGTVGNILYFVLWIGFLYSSVQPLEQTTHLFLGTQNDVFGITPTLSELSSSIKEKHNDYTGMIYFGISIKDLNKIITAVEWEGVEWKHSTYSARIGLVGVSLLLMSLSGLLFFRFDPAYERRKKFRNSLRDRSYIRNEETNIIFPVVQKIITPILSVQRWMKFEQMLYSEMKKLVKETTWWWFVVSAVLLVVCVVAPFEIMREWLLPAAWVWPLFIWSRLGMRLSEHYRHKNKNQDAQRDAMLMQVLWTVGVLVALVTGAGAAIRFVLAGEWSSLAAWIISATFIPSLAFVLSIWTNSNYAFEGIYTLLWLVGCTSKQPLLDFLGTLQDSVVVQNPFLYLIWTIALITFAAVGKQRLIEH